MHVRVVVLQCSAYKIFLPVSGFLSLPFLTQFLHMRSHIQEQGFGNKMYISELFTVVGYLHTAGSKNHWEIYCTKCSHYSVVVMVSGTREQWLHCHSGSHCVGDWWSKSFALYMEQQQTLVQHSCMCIFIILQEGHNSKKSYVICVIFLANQEN